MTQCSTQRGPLAVVTGASSGIGRAIAIGLSHRGYRMVLVARRKALLEDLAADLSENAPSVALPLDLADVDAIGPAMTELCAEHGDPSVLVNCAGFGVFAPFPEQGADEFRRLLRVNFEAAVEMTRALLPGLLREARHGGVAHVFNICSMAARVGPYGHAGYAAAKGAMRSFTEVMQAEHAGQSVRFTLVYPGIVRSAYFAKGTMSQLWPRVARHAVEPEQVSRAVFSSLGRDRASVYVPRRCRMLDWIVAASPRAARWLVMRGMRACSDGAPPVVPSPGSVDAG